VHPTDLAAIQKNNSKKTGCRIGKMSECCVCLESFMALSGVSGYGMRTVSPLEAAWQRSINNSRRGSRTNADTVSSSDDGSGESQDTEEPAEAKKTAETKANGEKLTAEEQTQVTKLEARDQEVRTHEAAHLAAAGGLARGGASYSYQQGPDGKQYAVGGEVSLDSGGGSTPEETISKARQIRAAALAPAEPSGQDLSVASSSQLLEASALRELVQNRQAESAQGAPKAARSAGQHMMASAFASAYTANQSATDPGSSQNSINPAAQSLDIQA
jgi:hypothetical protein